MGRSGTNRQCARLFQLAILVAVNFVFTAQSQQRGLEPIPTYFSQTRFTASFSGEAVALGAAQRQGLIDHVDQARRSWCGVELVALTPVSAEPQLRGKPIDATAIERLRYVYDLLRRHGVSDGLIVAGEVFEAGDSNGVVFHASSRSPRTCSGERDPFSTDVRHDAPRPWHSR